ncbi:aromatic amino acid transaminase [Amaricoccus solimangrovi]|uniref:Aminotransferase n=1 Tax=Amaricoccus solimangrovi TaxID=2589815 RepID=A0A501WYU4_9RHOB|nr:amino acid aminotransferase [Amaricoccus solimangrovi]TPE52221.1 aspartate/tyrosine/aromatic aminotransferase [Amaricoccus solimangrovi]
MLEALNTPAPDKIIELMGLYAADTREDKLDLGVGVYKDAQGRTPIMHAVKAAEKRLWEEQTTKSYVALLGDTEFVEQMRGLIFGEAVPTDRIAGCQTPGGTGAVHQLFELIQRADPEASVWYSDPTWPNHPAMLAHLGIEAKTYRYFDAATCEVDFEGMLADLAGAKVGDVVLLHGCCHNPTGANPTLEQWRTLAELFARRGLVPMIDLAYQGFGDGIDSDVAGLRYMAGQVPEMLVAASCSKNFGLYRDRVGAAFAISSAPNLTPIARGNLASLNRMNFSFPPDHGAKTVAIILGDSGLRMDWVTELEGMRRGMLTLRQSFAEALRRATNSDRYDFVATHRGMFSRLGLTPEQVALLRSDHGIYMTGDSRINIAGLPAQGLDKLAAAIAAVE